MTDKTLEILDAVREASLSVACLMDDCDDDEGNEWDAEWIMAIEHIQDKITILENYLGTKYYDFETKDILVNTWLQNYRRETNG